MGARRRSSGGSGRRSSVDATPGTGRSSDASATSHWARCSTLVVTPSSTSTSCASSVSTAGRSRREPAAHPARGPGPPGTGRREPPPIPTGCLRHRDVDPGVGRRVRAVRDGAATRRGRLPRRPRRPSDREPPRRSRPLPELHPLLAGGDGAPTRSRHRELRAARRALVVHSQSAGAPVRAVLRIPGHHHPSARRGPLFWLLFPLGVLVTLAVVPLSVALAVRTSRRRRTTT